MKKAIIYAIVFLISVSLALAASVTRDLPSSVSKGETFTVTYKATSPPSGNWGVLIEDDISGGCNPIELNTGWLSPQTEYSATFTAPSSDTTCTFVGNFQFAASGGELPETNMASQTVTVGEGGLTHKECQNKNCVIVSGAGTDECSTDADCNGEISCKERLDCEFWEECNKDETKCQIAIWVWIAGALLLLLIFFGGKRRKR